MIVTSNQSGVARGFYDEAAVNALHAWMNEELSRHGGRRGRQARSRAGAGTAPTIAELQATGCESLRAMAAGLEERGSRRAVASGPRATK